MATYKVLQDIEAEDKLIGPLTLRQFIFAGIALTCAYLSVMSIIKGTAFFLAFLLPPMLFCAVMAWPWSRDQPTETWLLAKLRFFFKPRRRIWDQSGIKQLVTITAPKREEHIYSNNLSQTEVKSRLKALANTIDSRGWAIKNVDVNLFAQPTYVTGQATDRLIDPLTLPQEVSNTDVFPADDILDAKNNPTAQHLDQMINATSKTRRQNILSKMQHAKQPDNPVQQPDYWFMNQPGGPPPKGYATFDNSPLVSPGAQATIPAVQLSKQEEQALSAALHNKVEKPKAAYGHMLTIDPTTGKAKKQQKSEHNGQKTGQVTPEIQNLAQNNDLNIATIARQANKPKSDEPPTTEVVIPLR